MKATRIVRRIDDLVRVVIPKEIRRTMRIREGDPYFTSLTQIDRFCLAIHSVMERYHRDLRLQPTPQPRICSAAPLTQGSLPLRRDWVKLKLFGTTGTAGGFRYTTNRGCLKYEFETAPIFLKNPNFSSLFLDNFRLCHK